MASKLDFTQAFLKNERVRLFLAFIGICLATALPRLVALDRFVTPDEHLWVTRSANFYFALGQRDFAATFQKQHPGVTAMWAGTAAFLLEYPEYRGSGMGQLDSDQFHYYLTKVRQRSPLELLVIGRGMLVLGQTLILGLAFLYAVQLSGLLPALVGFLFIAFDPFHLGLTRLLHLDGLFSNLVLLSLLALLAYYERRSRLALVVSGLAAGLGWLTKSPALFLIPAAGLLFLALHWKALWEAAQQQSFLDLWKTIRPMLVWLAVGALVFILLWPAMWVQPVKALSLMLGRAQSMADAGHNSAVFFNGRVFEAGHLGLEVFYFYPLAYIWRVSPLVLLGLGLAVWGLRIQGFPFDRLSSRKLALGLLLLALVFCVGFTLASKKFDRYLLPAFAPLDLLAGLGWVYAAGRLNNAGSRRWLSSVLLCAVVILQAAAALRVSPYYLDYYNPWLGGIQKAERVMQIGWGEGLDQAARYLNRLPNAPDLHVSSWYAAGSFSYFFVGHVRPIGYQSEMTEHAWEQFFTSDYAVIYAHQWQRQVPKPVLEYVARLEPVHTVSLNGFEYVRIYKLH